MIHITSTIDNSFTNPLAVMLISLFETNKNARFKIHVISADLNTENIAFIQKITSKYQHDFEYYKIDIDLFENFPINSRISLAAYYRIIIPSIIDKAVDKYLYLDADIIINGDITPLWESNLEGKTIAAVHDITAVESQYYTKHKIPHEFKYFNSGVLLVDKKQWEKENVTERTRKYLSDNKEICRFHDQDGLNAVLFNDRHFLSPIWNQQIGFYFMNESFLVELFGKNIYSNAFKSPIIIHFNGIEKPWHFLCGHPYKKKFDNYRKIAGIKSNYTDKNIKNRMKVIAYKIIGWNRFAQYFYKKTRISSLNTVQKFDK